MRRLRGFTLIELAVVMFVGALILGGIVQYLALQVATAKVTATKNKQDAIKVALTNFLSRNSRLPCPAVAAIGNGVANNGVEAPTPGTCTGTAINGSVATGTVPWVTLGLTSESAIDGYTNRFTYQVVLAATNLSALPGAGTQSVAGMKGAIRIFDSGALATQINSCAPGTPTDNPCLAVVVIVSHGINGSGAFNDAGIQNQLPVGADELENVIASPTPNNTNNVFVVKGFSDALANPYDDIVMALTPSDLLASLTATGGLQDFRSALNANFSVIKNALISNATRNGSPQCVAGSCSPTTNCSVVGLTCEVAQYTYTLSASLPALPNNVLNDPWGNPIIYAPNSATQPAGLDYSGLGGTVRDIRPTTGLDVNAFTMKSFGPNGADDACLVDDICVNVSVGEFQTLASKFR